MSLKKVQQKLAAINARLSAKKNKPIVVKINSKRGPTIAKCDVHGNVWVYSHYVEEYIRSKFSWLYEGQEKYVRQRVRHEWQPTGGKKRGLKSKEKYLTSLKKNDSVSPFRSTPKK
jgi:hypothetical protein